MNKKLTALFLTLVMVMSCVTCFAAGNGVDLEWGDEYKGYVDANQPTFKDVKSGDWAHWAAKNISRVVAAGMMNGYPDGTFRPDAPITRAEVLTVLVKYEGYPLQDTVESSFTDVKPTDWYSPYVEAGKHLFPVKNTHGAFRPNMPATREDVIYALVEVKNFDVPYEDQSVLRMFSDAYSISAACRKAVTIAVNNNLVSGYPNGTIGAQDPLTRAEFATLLCKGSYVGIQ